MNYTFSRFTKQDYPLYKKWINDRYLRTFLGGMDKDWLAYILEESERTDFAIHQNHSLVGVAGIQKSEMDLQYMITNFCINPNLEIDKIGAKNTAGLVKFALRNNLIEN